MVNYGYFETHEMPDSPTRKKRRRVGEYDPKAKKSDKRYTVNYGL